MIDSHGSKPEFVPVRRAPAERAGGGLVATYQVICWKGIPSLVEAQDGDRTARVPLSQRFQDLIDAVAMRQGASESQAYLDGWEVGPVTDLPGSSDAVAQAVAAELEGTFEEVLRKTLPAPSP